MYTHIDRQIDTAHREKGRVVADLWVPLQDFIPGAKGGGGRGCVCGGGVNVRVCLSF